MNQKKKIENYQQIAMGLDCVMMKPMTRFMGKGMGLTLSSMHPMQDIRI